MDEKEKKMDAEEINDAVQKKIPIIKIVLAIVGILVAIFLVISIIAPCSLYGHQFEITSREEPTCAKGGSELYTCKKCGETKEEYLLKKLHNWGNYVVTEKATTEHQGSKYKICRDCGYKRTEAIPQKIKHNKSSSTNKSSSNSFQDETKDWMKDQAKGKSYNYDDGGKYPCMGKNDTCPNYTHNAYDLYCDKCDPDGDNVEG